MLMTIIEASDTSLKAHSERVASISVDFSKSLRRLKTQIDHQNIYVAGLLHDIGKVCLTVKGHQAATASASTGDVQKQLPELAHTILSHLNIFQDIGPIVRHTKEHYNGSGYPKGLAGEQIPIESRIIALVDHFDQLVVDTETASTGLDPDAALDQMRVLTGRQYDRHLFCQFESYVKTHKIGQQHTEPEANRQGLKDLFIEIAELFKKGKLDLPVLPKIAEEVERVINQMTSTTADIAQIVEKDAVLSVKLISIANSPVYRGVERISEVRTAISRMGVKETQNIVAAIAQKSLYQSVNKQFQPLFENLWRHSLACAYAASAMAKQLEIDGSEQYFLIGLVHDIGQTLLLKALADRLSDNDAYDLDDIKAGIQGVHAGFAKALLARWHFNPDFIKAATQHTEEMISDRSGSGELIVNLASHLAESIGFSPFGESQEDLKTLLATSMLDISEEFLQRISNELQDIMQDTSGLF